MAMRRGKRTRSEMPDDDKVGVEEEMEKWQQVANMIGGSLDDVCNMAEGERSELVLLISAEKSRKDNIDTVKDDDDDVLVASSDSDDDLYRKKDVDSYTNAREGQVPEPSLKKVKVMIDKCEVDLVDLTSLSNDSGQSSSFNSYPENSKNSTATLGNETEIKSPIFKKTLKKTLLKPTTGDIGDLKSVECDDKHNERKTLNALFQKVLTLSSNNKLNDASFLKGTLQPIVSNTEYFRAMDKNPQKYKFDKQIPSLVYLEKSASSKKEDIYKCFESVKFVKSQAVCTGKEGPNLVSVATDGSVKEGFAALKLKRRKELEEGSRRQEGSVRNEGARFTRTTRNSINDSFDIFDDMFDIGANDSAEDFEIDDNDYVDELEINKKGTSKFKTSRIIKSDSDDDFKVDDKDVKKGKTTKNTKTGTRRNPPGTGENKLGGNDKRKTTRGRDKGKLAQNDVNDVSQTSILNFVDSIRIGNLNANEKVGAYDPMSNLVKLGGDQGNASSATRRHDPFSNLGKSGVDRNNTPSVAENSHDSMPQLDNIGADRSSDPSRMMHRNNEPSSRDKMGAGRSSTLSTGEREVLETIEDQFRGKTGICPLCMKLQWKSLLEKHAAECTGDTQGTGSKELCPECFELIPAEAFKDHYLRGCSTN